MRFIHELICYEGVTYSVEEALAVLQKKNTVYNFQTLLLQINKVNEKYELNVCIYGGKLEEVHRQEHKSTNR
ncbi:hypothetical protein [Virgibacillus proomii]|uniref:hypothetical protein n=1 Tax=Virgibacillus proomii TaxID=84407 RepID=UPI001C12955A|nr:hypothetical protein [Virgibacillus proomii]MBU5267548.1 hypothetical protein [Virgibacillus proomii]